jgi:hypothetical protein
MSNKSKERLFIKKIEIENCGRFYGPGHSVVLSDSPEKNITIIIGYSGRGKSTIHDLIYWCLYGEHKKHTEDEHRGLDYGLINTNALENLSKGESVTASVTLSLHNDKEEKYLLTRQLKATFNQDSVKREFEPQNNSRVPSGMGFETSAKLIMKNETGDKIIEKNSKIIKNEINEQFPQNLSDFFLFDGENLVKFKNQTSSSDFIKDGITKISGLEILDSLMKNSKNTAEKIQTHIGGKSANAAPYSATETRLSGEMETLKQEIESDEKKLLKIQAILNEVSDKIKKNKDGSKLLDEQIKAQKNKSTASKELKQNNDNIKDMLFENIPQLLIRNVLQNAEKIFERLENEDKIPPSISRGAIDKILNSNPLKCVCGREFEKNEHDGEPWMVLNKIKGAIIEDDLSQGISLGRDLISRIIDVTSIQKLRKSYNELLEIRREKRQSIRGHDAEIDDLGRQLKEIEYDKQEDLGSLKAKYWQDYTEQSGLLKIKKDELDELNTTWNDNHKLLEDALAKEGRYDTEKTKIVLGKAVSKFTKHLEKRIEEILRTETQKATSKYFLESAPEKQTFDHVDISENYDIMVKDSSGLVASLSKGQAHVLGLAYVAGIREITHTNTFLIIDSPLHNISGIPRNEISEVFSKYLPGVQVVLLVTDTEYLHGDPNGAEPVINILRKNGRIWKEYFIDEVVTKEGIQSRQIKEYSE